MLNELKIIRDSDKDLRIIFSFLERVAGKLVKVSVDYKTETTITFIDYNDNAEYYVAFDKVNRILDYCYNEYYFKIILSGSDFYQKVHKLSLELDIEPYVFDLFFRCLFVAIKVTFQNETKNTPEVTKINFYNLVLNAPSDTFDDIPRIDFDFFSERAKFLLKKLEDSNIINFHSNDVTGDYRFQSYFAISSDTFKFFRSTDSGFEFFSSTFEILDLISYCNAQSILNHNLLKKLDKIVHMVILASFEDKEVRFYNNKDSDNCYIKQLNKNREEIKRRNQFIMTI